MSVPRVGAEVYGAMRAIKEALDPRSILNPGVMFSTTEWWESRGGLEAREPLRNARTQRLSPGPCDKD